MDQPEPLEELFAAVLGFLGAWHIYMSADHSDESDDVTCDDAMLVRQTVGELRDACDAVLTL